MIIYGTRMYGKKNRIRSHGRCVHCARVGVHNSYDGRKWGHLYFIPLIPEGGKVRVLRECKACGMGSHFPVEQVPAIVESIKSSLDQAVVALGAGETEIELNGESVPVTSVIGSHMADLYCFVGEVDVRQCLENLKFVNAGDELVLAEGIVAEVMGFEAEADTKFGELVERSENPLILYHAAQYSHRRGKVREAIALAERVETSLVTDLNVKQLLNECYTAVKDWAKLVGTYENCFQIEPALKENKAIIKAYKKACKKAGRPPQIG